MTKISFNDKIERFPVSDEDYQLSADNVNEIKESVNDLYDATGVGPLSDNVIVVSINTGGATNKIKDTLDSITDSSANKPYLVKVRPGSGVLAYSEDNFTIPQYVSLISEGGTSTAQIAAITTTGVQITMSEGSKIQGFQIIGKTAGTSISMNNSGIIGIKDISIIDSNDGIVINNASAIAYLENITFVEGIQGILTDGIRTEAGNSVIYQVQVIEDCTIGNSIIKSTGVNTICTISSCNSESSNVLNAINVEDKSFVNLYDLFVENCDKGIFQSGGSRLTVSNVKGYNLSSNGYRCETGTGGLNEVTFSGVIWQTVPGGFDSYVLTPNLLALGGPGQLDMTKTSFNPAANIVMQIYNQQEGDESSVFLSELHVGTPTIPRRTNLGEGEAHVQLLAYTTTDDISFTDITASVKSASGSTFTFPSLAAGSSIYLTNLFTDTSSIPLPFYGFQTYVNTAAVLGTGSFTIQYYNSTSGWIDFSYMETQADRRYYQYANDIFTHTGSHHIRGPIELTIETDPTLTWDLNDPPSTGTNRYWLRLRVVSAITTSPIFEQFKIHSNIFKVNGDGWTEYFGSSRPKKNLPIISAVGRELIGSMSNSNIFIDQNLGEGLIDNQFSATTQYCGFSFTMPDDLDTSSGIKFILACRGDGAGVVTLQCIIGKVTEGDLVYTSNPSLIPIPSRATYTDTQTFSGANELLYFTFNIDVSEFRARKDPVDGTTAVDLIFVTINATTLPVNIQKVHLENYYYSWSSGGHV